MLQIIRRTAYAALLAGKMATLAAGQARQTPNPFKLPSDADIRKILADRIDTLAAQEKILDACAGHYDAKEEGVFLIVRERDFLTMQMPVGWGLPKFRLRPESSRDFFVAELPIRVTVQTDTNGQVNGILVYPPRGQREHPAHRMSLDE